MHRANRRALAAFLLLSLYLLSRTRAEAGSLNVTAMTQNLYVGADTTPILTATTLSELQTAITVAAQSVIDNNFPKRAAAIAAEAASVGGPLLIGLQEAEIVSGPAGTLNYADTMVAALAARGLNYTTRSRGWGRRCIPGSASTRRQLAFLVCSASPIKKSCWCGPACRVLRLQASSRRLLSTM